MNPKKSSKEPSNGHERENEWSEVIRGEGYIIRTSSAETNGVYSVLEVVADPRNGVPMHVHDNADEHFIILEGRAFIANGDSRVEVAAGSFITITRGVPHAWLQSFQKAPVRMLVIFSPGHSTELFRKHATTEPAEMTALANKYGTRVTGPALFDDLYTRLSPRP